MSDLKNDVRWKYQNNVVFNHIVDSMAEMIAQGLTTRDELIDAVNLAHSIYERNKTCLLAKEQMMKFLKNDK